MRDVADPRIHVVVEIQNSSDTIAIRQGLSFHRFQEEPQKFAQNMGLESARF